MPSSYPLVNGLRFDYSSVSIFVGNQQFWGIKSIKYNQTLVPGKIRGTNAQVIGRTRGVLDSDGSIEIYRAEFADIIAFMGTLPGAAANQLGFMEVAFDVLVSYNELSTPGILSQDKLVGCRIKKTEVSGQEGGDGITVNCDLDIMYILMGANAAEPLTPLGAPSFFK